MSEQDTFQGVLVDPWVQRAPQDRPAVGELTYAELLDRARRAAGAIPAGARVRLDLPPSTDFAVALHGAWLAGAVVVTGDADVVLDAVPDGPPADPRPHDLEAVALELRTSGTTGPPKTVPLTFGNLLWSALGAAVALGRRPDDRWLCCLPLTHVGGLQVLVRSAIWGTSCVVHDGFDAGRVLAERFSVVSLVPTTLRRLLDAGWRGEGVRAVVLGGAAIDPALLERAAHLPVRTTYGMTETASMVVVDGRPVPFARVAAEDGELVVRGPMVSGGEHRTRDRGIVEPDGGVRVLGRADDVIITGGENVAPDQVEAVLAQHPLVAEAAVFGRPDPEWGQAVCAAVVPREGLDPEDLRAWAAQRLQRFEVPKRIELRDDLPRNAAGKVLRREL
jgi:o-succinylbenzoate---CoA ligase